MKTLELFQRIVVRVKNMVYLKCQQCLTCNKHPINILYWHKAYWFSKDFITFYLMGINQGAEKCTAELVFHSLAKEKKKRKEKKTLNSLRVTVTDDLVKILFNYDVCLFSPLPISPHSSSC